MNKVKMFFVAAALLLTTAGVFAGKAKFASISNVYGYNTSSGLYDELLNGTITTDNLTTSGTTQATITGATTTLSLYYYSTSASSYYKLYASGF